MDKFETVFDISSDSFYEIETNKDYEEIKPISKCERSKIYLKSILYKIDFKDDILEELENYYYICNKCDKLVYYFERNLHISSHIEETNVCCDCVIL